MPASPTAPLPPGAHVDAVFDAGWLTLRAPADTAARATAITAAAGAWLRPRASAARSLKLLDLGSGSGANPCYLAARLPGPQHWTLLDHDPALLATAATRAASLHDAQGRSVAVSTRCADLRTLPAAAFAGFDLVSASALLDLVDEVWLESLVRACGQGGAAVLVTLSVDGSWGFHGAGEDADDAFVRAAFNAHQRGDKGVGGALGPDAAVRFAHLLRGSGFEVRVAPSPWRLAMGESSARCLAEALVAGWRDVALAQCPAASGRIHAWYERRRACLARDEVILEVGHLDLFAAPPLGAGGRRPA